MISCFAVPHKKQLLALWQQSEAEETAAQSCDQSCDHPPGSPLFDEFSDSGDEFQSPCRERRLVFGPKTPPPAIPVQQQQQPPLPPPSPPPSESHDPLPLLHDPEPDITNIEEQDSNISNISDTSLPPPAPAVAAAAVVAISEEQAVPSPQADSEAPAEQRAGSSDLDVSDISQPEGTPTQSPVKLEPDPLTVLQPASKTPGKRKVKCEGTVHVCISTLSALLIKRTFLSLFT